VSDMMNESIQAEVGTSDLASLVDVPVDAAPAEVAAPEPDVSESVEAAPVARDEPARSFDPLFATIDDDDLQLDGFYDKITEQDIKDLPPVARRMLHNFRVAYKLEQKKFQQGTGAVERKFKSRENSLHEMERDFARRQSEFASVIDDPRVKEAMNTTDSELPDIMTEAGIEARIQRGIAQGLTSAFEPMREAASERKQESAYLDFLEGHPEMRDSGFKKTVANLVRERKSTTSPLSTQDAYEIVRARNVMEQQQKRAQSERRARAESARQVKRSAVSGSPGVEEIPNDVKKQGAASIASWLQQNPEAAKRISKSLF